MENRSLFTSIVYGLITVFLLVLCFSFLFSLLLRFTSMTESSLDLIILIITFVSLLIGGFVSGGKSQQKGWLVGASTGLTYSVVVFLIQFLGYNNLFSLSQYMVHAGYIFTAIIGGVLGVNMVRKNRMV